MKTLYIVTWTRAGHHYIAIERVYAESRFEAVSKVLVQTALSTVSGVPRQPWRIQLGEQFASYKTVPDIETLQQDLRSLEVYFNVEAFAGWGSKQYHHLTRNRVQTLASLYTTDPGEEGAARGLARCFLMECNYSNLDSEEVFRQISLEVAREKQGRRGGG